MIDHVVQKMMGGQFQVDDQPPFQILFLADTFTFNGLPVVEEPVGNVVLKRENLWDEYAFEAHIANEKGVEIVFERTIVITQSSPRVVTIGVDDKAPFCLGGKLIDLAYNFEVMYFPNKKTLKFERTEGNSPDRIRLLFKKNRFRVGFSDKLQIWFLPHTGLKPSEEPKKSGAMLI